MGCTFYSVAASNIQFRFCDKKYAKNYVMFEAANLQQI